MMFRAFYTSLPQATKMRGIRRYKIPLNRPAAAACREYWYFAFKIFCNFSSSDCEPVKFVALSECNLLEQPLRDVKRRNAAMQPFVDRSDTSSKCMALLVLRGDVPYNKPQQQQQSRQMTLDSPCCFPISTLLKRTTEIQSYVLKSSRRYTYSFFW